MFDPRALPRASAVAAQSAEQLEALGAQLRERDEKLAAVLSDKTSLDAELERLRAEVAAAKKAAAAQPDEHDYAEQQTRDYFIDLLLKEAEWPLDQPRDRELEVEGMPNAEGTGYVDYVLWGDDGKPLALIEAKRTRRDARVGQQQAKLYADCLEKQHGRRPVIYYSNGYEHWLWDDVHYAAAGDEAKFRAKARAFLRAHQDHVVVHKLRTNKPLTATDLAELERILAESGAGQPDDWRRAAEASNGLGLFVRSLIGLDRGAAKEALAGFLGGKQFSANQIEFVNLVVDHLTEHGAMAPESLYESPFTDLAPSGPEAIFTSAEVEQIFAAVEHVARTAAAASFAPAGAAAGDVRT